jgi:uncharacterized protein YbjT (DUF2867 family)
MQKEKKIVAVVGATGAQGGGLARALLAEPDGEFAVRALTRDPSTAQAQALARDGAEVVAADVSSRASIERAFAGAHAAYCVTFFWNHMSAERELEEARTLAQSARTAGLQHVVWSTLEDTRRHVPLDDPRMPTLQGRYKVPHFDAKGEADEFFRASGVPTTFLLTSFYWDNLIHFGMAPRAGADGKLHFLLPMGDRPLPGIAAEDIGRCALGLLRRADEFAGRTVGVAGEHLTGAQMAAALGQALGREVVHDSMPFEAYRSLGFPGADDLGNMFQFNHDCSDAFRASRSVELSRSLNPQLQTFAQWLERHARELPVQ